MKKIDRFCFHLWVIFDDPKHWLKWKKDQVKAVWLWTRILAASLLIKPILESKEFFERKKKKGGAG